MESVWCMMLVSALLAPLAAGQTSGFYYDNGFQHVRERLLSRREQAQMQHKLLGMLGLPKAPALGEAAPSPSQQPAANRSLSQPHHHHPLDKKAAAPKFLMDVYRTLLDEEQHLNPAKTEFEMTGTDIHAMHESDVIMSFTNQVPPKVTLRHQRDQRLWFNVSQVPAGESLVAAELRINKKRLPLQNNEKEKFSITLSLLVPQADGEGLEKIKEVPFDSSSNGWILFNVTEALYKWVHNEEMNLGLIVTVTRSKTGKTIKPEEAGIVMAQTKSTEKQPFMVAFFKSDMELADSPVSLPTIADVPINEPENDLDEEEPLSKHSRSKRDLQKKKKKRADHSAISSFKHLVTDPSPVHRSDTSCQLRTMYVSFADLGWKDWIIAPDGYAAYYCAGECVFPLTSHMNATNHAIVQTLVHLLKPGQVPTPCCAPIKLATISVLYYMDSSSDVILKKYKNMVVKACGCQ